MRFPRSSGILLHPTSLPSRYGIGDLGDRAYRFIDFLAQAGQRLWQILPLGPTGYGDSPYQCFSASAGNPLLVSPDQLVADGYLDQSDLDDVPDFPVEYVDYGWVIQYKEQLLDKAFNRFEVNATDGQKSAFDSFCQERGEWLQDFALFMALKRHHMHHEGGVWNKWPSDIAFREPGAIEDWTEKLGREVESVKFAQFLFYTQWFALKRYANERDIKIVGDVPIFVAYDSADVWANRDLFFLDEAGDPTFVAGVPPDYFSETGQRWGNPLYRWKTLAARGYDWWVNRLRSNFELVDILRIDHFRGFQAYWAIPFSEPTAVVGKWAKGPGASFFRAMRDELGELPIIAEDLGVITSDVIALRKKFHFPGMKILQFAFGGECNNNFLPHSFEPNS
ncbi:MAG: 4-alpha-glucanotransferase, partial [Chloroflexota bacterium]